MKTLSIGRFGGWSDQKLPKVICWEGKEYILRMRRYEKGSGYDLDKDTIVLKPINNTSMFPVILGKIIKEDSIDTYQSFDHHLAIKGEQSMLILDLGYIYGENITVTVEVFENAEEQGKAQ